MFCGTPVISTYYHEAIDIKKNGSVFNLKKPIETFDKINLFNENDIVHSVERFKLENSSKNLFEILNETVSEKK